MCMKCFRYKIENMKNGNTVFTTDPEIADRLSRDGYRVTCKSFMAVKKMKHNSQEKMTGGY